jgi:hypothetical protein
MSIVLKGDYAAEIPKQYNLTYSSTDTYTQIFSLSDNGNSPALEGNVQYRCDVRPVITPEYTNLMKGNSQGITSNSRSCDQSNRQKSLPTINRQLRSTHQ